MKTKLRCLFSPAFRAPFRKSPRAALSRPYFTHFLFYNIWRKNQSVFTHFFVKISAFFPSFSPFVPVRLLSPPFAPRPPFSPFPHAPPFSAGEFFRDQIPAPSENSVSKTPAPFSPSSRRKRGRGRPHPLPALRAFLPSSTSGPAVRAL